MMLRGGTTHRYFLARYHFPRIKRAVAKISWYSDPLENDLARRDGILPAHVCLSTGALVLPASRTGGSIYNASGGCRT